jgi:hypothetical protein
VTDGPISGATVFADTNGNGVRDPDEGSTVTGTDGSFTLADTGGELIASGGTDASTGLANLFTFNAPAGSTAITPLTTLLDAYAALVGMTPQAAEPALLSGLGLAAGTDLTTLNPVTAATPQNYRLLRQPDRRRRDGFGSRRRLHRHREGDPGPDPRDHAEPG